MTDLALRSDALEEACEMQRNTARRLLHTE